MNSKVIAEEFQQNVELDARLVLASMGEGIDGVLKFAYRNRDIFTRPDDAVHRCLWLKTQPEQYICEVSDKVVELEIELVKKRP